MIWEGPFCITTGAGGITLLEAYNPTYAAALYGAAFMSALNVSSYAGLPTAFPAYSPGSSFAAAAAAAAPLEYPRGGYALPDSPGREAGILLPGMQGSQSKEL